MQSQFLDGCSGILSFIPGGNKTIAKKEMAKVPVFGMLYAMGSVLVDRKNEKSRRESYAKMKQVLQMGLHMSIYPEGTRNTTNEPLKSFHDGAFRLAIDTRKPIIPSLIFNTKKVLPQHKTFFLWPHFLEMHFCHLFKWNKMKRRRHLRKEFLNRCGIIMFPKRIKHHRKNTCSC